MAKANTFGQMGACMLVNGAKEPTWGMGGLVGLVGPPMRVNSRVVTWMGEAPTLVLMGTHTKGLG